jgi:glycosyltransferase involved in cell wall biosynthesis
MHERKKIRVAFGLPALLVGGIERQLVQQLHAYDQERFELHVITLFAPSEPQAHFYDDLPAHVRIHRIAFSGITDVKSWYVLLKVLRQLRPDIMISSMFSANTAFRLLKPFCGYRIIAREHNTYIEKNFLRRLLDHVLFYFTDALVAVSSDVADFIARQAWLPRERILVIPNGINLADVARVKGHASELRTQKRDALGVPDTARLILSVGRLKAQKNHQLLLQAFAEYIRSGGDAHLVLVGEGVERPALERLRDTFEESTRSKIHLVGYQKSYEWYGAVDLFVLVSRYEGFPNVLLEAIAFGLPIVTTRVPGVTELIQTGGITRIVGQEPSDIAQGLLATERVSTSRGQGVSVDDFRVEVIVARYARLIEDLMA